MKFTRESILSHAWYYVDRAYEGLTAFYQIAHNDDGYLTRLSRHVTWTLAAGVITPADLLLEARKELKYRAKHGIDLGSADYATIDSKITDSRFPDAHDQFGSIHVVDLGDEGLDSEQIKQVVLDVLQHNIDRDDEDREAYEEHLESISMHRAFFTADDKLGTLPFVGGCTICDVIITELRENTESWGIKELAQHFKDVHQMHLTVDPKKVLLGTGVGWPDLDKIPDSTNL
jgi:hypothetical protein